MAQKAIGVRKRLAEAEAKELMSENTREVRRRTGGSTGARR